MYGTDPPDGHRQRHPAIDHGDVQQRLADPPGGIGFALEPLDGGERRAAPSAAIGASGKRPVRLPLGKLEHKLDAAHHHEDLAAGGQQPRPGEDAISRDAHRQQARDRQPGGQLVLWRQPAIEHADDRQRVQSLPDAARSASASSRTFCLCHQWLSPRVDGDHQRRLPPRRRRAGVKRVDDPGELAPGAGNPG